METKPAPDDATASLLGETAPSRWTRLRRPLIIGAAVLAVAVAGLLLYRGLSGPKASVYVTEAMRRGDLVTSVTATGTLAPVNTVSVGSELSGTVSTVLVDDNDHVRRGQVLAQLDTARLNDQIALAEAALASAQANARETEATLRERDLAHSRNLKLSASSGGAYVARATLEASKAALDRARASRDSARAAIAQSQANLDTSRTNLAKATIRSPVDGVVLSRTIEPGQTVAASLQAPVLFILAEDLTRMELQVDIDEADVGQALAGQVATFSVDAFAGRTYQARLTRVGLGSKTTNGVVTYTGVLTVDNADQSLRPGMTATAEIVTRRREDVLLAPAAALRFSPPAAEAASGQTGLVASLTPRMPAIGGRRRTNGANTVQQVWTLRDGEPVALPVTVGASDGQWVEVSGANLAVGLALITGTDEAE
ncbi:MAG: efflux RND transporter periplasmic adaptor subunit [Caulobacter sp.]